MTHFLEKNLGVKLILFLFRDFFFGVTSIPSPLSSISGLFTPNKSHAYASLSSDEPSPSQFKTTHVV